MKRKVLFSFLVVLTVSFVYGAPAKTNAKNASKQQSAAKKAAMAETGAIDLSSFMSVDSWALKYNEEAYTLTANGCEYFQFPLPKALMPGQTINVHVKGINNGNSGFRCWTVDEKQTTNSNLYLSAAKDALPKGPFNRTYKLTATAPSSFIFFKGPQYGVMIENIVITSLSITY